MRSKKENEIHTNLIREFTMMCEDLKDEMDLISVAGMHVDLKSMLIADDLTGESTPVENADLVLLFTLMAGMFEEKMKSRNLKTSDFISEWNKEHTSSPSFQDAINWTTDKLSHMINKKSKR